MHSQLASSPPSSTDSFLPTLFCTTVKHTPISSRTIPPWSNIHCTRTRLVKMVQLPGHHRVHPWKVLSQSVSYMHECITHALYHCNCASWLTNTMPGWQLELHVQLEEVCIPCDLVPQGRWDSGRGSGLPHCGEDPQLITWIRQRINPRHYKIDSTYGAQMVG